VLATLKTYVQNLFSDVLIVLKESQENQKPDEKPQKEIPDENLQKKIDAILIKLNENVNGIIQNYYPGSQAINQNFKAGSTANNIAQTYEEGSTGNNFAYNLDFRNIKQVIKNTIEETLNDLLPGAKSSGIVNNVNRVSGKSNFPCYTSAWPGANVLVNHRISEA